MSNGSKTSALRAQSLWSSLAAEFDVGSLGEDKLTLLARELSRGAFIGQREYAALRFLPEFEGPTFRGTRLGLPHWTVDDTCPHRRQDWIAVLEARLARLRLRGADPLFIDATARSLAVLRALRLQRLALLREVACEAVLI